MDDKIIEKICDLTDRRKKEEILKDAYKEIKYTERSKTQYVASVLIGLCVGMLVGFSKNTVEIMRSAVDSANGIMIAFVAMIFGSYSIFQALLSENLVKLLIDSEGNILKESNETFLNLTILYVIGICFNFIFGVILKIIPDNFLIVKNVIACDVIAFFGIATYITLYLLLLLEVINFAINLYRMFCVYNTLKAIETLDDKENEE